jgi:predicted nucleotidyltransferase
MDLRSVLVEIHTALRDASIEHALIGGLALAAHGAARATTDLDLLADGERADDVDRIVRARGWDCLHRTQEVANYASADRAKGRVDFLFARRAHGRAMLARAREHPILGESVRVVDAADLIGLKVQSSSNDPSRRHRDLADIERLLRAAKMDLGRVREYFRLFDREKELDALLAGAPGR